MNSIKGIGGVSGGGVPPGKTPFGFLRRFKKQPEPGQPSEPGDTLELSDTAKAVSEIQGMTKKQCAEVMANDEFRDLLGAIPAESRKLIEEALRQKMAE